MKDLFGKAMWDFISKNNPESIITETSISEAEEMEIDYMFRDFEAMPFVEQKALLLSYGKILDVGCGAGSHALYLQNDKKLDVTAIDISVNAIKTSNHRGVKNAHISDLFEFHSEKKFDTILLLMNGTGICGKIRNLNLFLQKLKSLINTDGQILIDSTDINYMYDKDINNNSILPFKMEYYGELEFFLTYKNQQEIPFDWLYLDFETLGRYCAENNLIAEKIIEGENSEYLARIIFQ